MHYFVGRCLTPAFLSIIMLLFPAFSIAGTFDANYCVKVIAIHPKGGCVVKPGNYRAHQYVDDKTNDVVVNFGGYRFHYGNIQEMPSNSMIVKQRATGRVYVNKQWQAFSETIIRAPRRSTDKHDKPAHGQVTFPQLNCSFQYRAAHDCPK